MSFYTNLTTKKKLILGFSIIVSLTMTIGIVAYFQINKLIEADAKLYEKGVVALEKIGIVSANFQRVRCNVREIILETTPEEIALREKRIWMFREEAGAAATILEKVLPDDEARRLFAAFMEARKNYGAHLKQTIEMAKENQDADATRFILKDAYKTELIMITEIGLLSEYLTKSAKQLSDQNSAEARTSAQILLILAFSSTLLAAILAMLITRSIATPLQKILNAVLSQQEVVKEKSRLAEAISAGDLAQEVIISQPLQLDIEQVSDDEVGTLLKAIVTTSATQHSLDTAFAGMSDSLRHAREQEALSSWFKEGQNKLNIIMRGEKPITELAEQALAFLTDYLCAGVGIFYVYDQQRAVLTYAASYAITQNKRQAEQITLGEGLAGQAALEKKMIILNDVPPGYLRISSGLGESEPAHIVALPLLFNGSLVGLVELGSFTAFGEEDLEFLKQIMEALAIALSVNISRQQVNELLEQTQAQTEELRVQQEELQQTNEELEERAEMLEQQREQIRATNREIEQASADLQRKATELERVSTYKSEFLANMSHELRTPLNSLMILSSLLRDNREGNLSPKQIEFAATINGAGRDLLNLINDILDLSKIESGHMEFNFETLVVPELCNQLLNILEPISTHKGIEFKVTLDDSAPQSIVSDSQRTLQILKNLLSNACKFTSSGSVSLRVSTPASHENLLATPSIAFAVTDTGIGIPQEKHSLIFNAFQQADGSTSRSYGGTGLGLSISRQLARSMGGEITLVSEPGVGSTFTLLLPIRQTNQTSQTGQTGQTGQKPTLVEASHKTNLTPLTALPMPLLDDREQAHEGGKSILIIEDDLSFAGVLIRMVRDRGFLALVAADGESGIGMSERYRPSAIILDVMLPHIDGWGVMRSLKDNPLTRHIPVHFITCLEERQKAMSMGAVGFVTKPVSGEQMDSVFEALESALEKTTKSLLIVEDDPAQASAMEALLQERNITITIAESGAAAIDVISRELIDCIVLDLGLADMGAFELLEELKKRDQGRRIPVIIHTGRDLTREDEAQLRHYAESIIIKGAKSPERLLNEVSLFLHLIETSLDPDKQRMIRSALDKEALLEGKKILIVDDDMRNVFSLSSALAEKNILFFEAENGFEALKQLNLQPDIDLILMDIMMPEMDGYEAMRKIRADARFHNLPIIALTAKAMKGDREECLKAGASDYIPKPVDMEKLFSLLRVWLYSTETKPSDRPDSSNWSEGNS
ncbi:MAG TPA: response regulator [Desulfuromonadales bacterium]|nr:response regulator [Desulfuromonadales bacterium]